MKKIIFLISLICLSSTKGFAWGHLGHSLVAEVAFSNLDAKTKQNVLKYLDGMSIEDASNWMDAMRSDKNYNYMKPYHYVNFDKGASVTELSGDNIINVLNKTLKDLDNIKGLSNDEVRTRLFYLFHLIGDLHQPLHVGYKDDKGGNTVQISFFGRGTNLHAMWDTDIIEYKNLTLADELKLNTFQPSELALIKQINVNEWAKGSRSYLKVAYNLNDGKIGDMYVNSAYPIIQQQILKAGLRLASVLEHYFKDVNFVTSTSLVKLDEPVSVDVNKLFDYEGKLVKVCSKVYGTKFLESVRNKPTFLNVGGDYPNSPLTILIWGDSRANFSDIPEKLYLGKNICVTGKVLIYKGKPEIVISKESEIEIK